MPAAQLHYPDAQALIDDYHARGWTDGLPIVPPTPEAVAEALAATGLDADDVVGTVPSWSMRIRAEQVAINAVMAGCLPEYLPTLVAALRAITAPEANCHSTLATTNNPSQVVVVNGPVRHALGLRCEQGVLGPANRAGATIGRAVNLIVRNVLGVLPGGLDQSVFSFPGRHGIVFGENEEEAAPWVPLAAERGVAAGTDAVTVFAGYPPLLLRPPYGVDAEGLLDSYVDKLHCAGGVWGEGRPGQDLLVLVAKENMRTFLDAGWSKADLRTRLFERLAALRGRPQLREGEAPCMLSGPDDILVVAAGGGGNPITMFFTAHAGRAVTRTIDVPSASS